MIPCKPASEHTPQWKKLFANSYVGLKALAKLHPQYSQNKHQLDAINKLFPIQITEQLLHSHPINGAVLKQYLPNELELKDSPHHSENPVGDIEATQLPGVIKKYRHRVLLITSNTCPVHCRYCFRKNFPYSTTSPNVHLFKDALTFCKQDLSINEVILSGGDPLSLDDDMLEYLFESISKIDHIKTIRLHTKYPSVFPQRITSKLLATLNNSSLNKVCVFHINHPDEINDAFCDAAQKIKQTNTTTLNQSVLLKDVNNNADTLIELSRKLFNCGVIPYYLHMLDPAKGTQHFHIDPKEAHSIVNRMKSHLPGYLVPKLAQEIAGQDSKFY